MDQFRQPVFILGASVVFAILYGLGLMPAQPMWLAMASKGICVALLAYYAYLHRDRGPVMTSLALALGLGAIGDIFLAAQFNMAFIHGLVAFLAGHLVYISIFRKAPMARNEVDIIRLSICGAVVLAAAFQAFYLWHHLGDQKIASIVYMAVLTIMTCMAVLSRYALRLAGLGAVLFFASDIILGFVFFDPETAIPRWLNWWVYYPGQLLLAIGIAAGPAEAGTAGEAPVCRTG